MFEANELSCGFKEELKIPATWFINPSNIVEQREYTFSLLNTLFDNINDEIFRFHGKSYSITSQMKKESLRSIIKGYLKEKLPHDKKSLAHIKELCNENKVITINLPRYARTVSMNELKEINPTYISLMNHSWEHDFICNLTLNEVYHSFHKAQNWIYEHFGNKPTHYALPYGVMPERMPATPETFIYLLDYNKKNGIVANNTFNRVCLNPERKNHDYQL